MNYGPVLAAAFVLWPVMAVLGGQGFAPLVGLTGVAALVFARPRIPLASFAYIGFAFVAWAALSEFWSPGSRQLVLWRCLGRSSFGVELNNECNHDMADGEGFEPPVALRPRRFSRPVP